jgi:hypothetical protein
VQYAAQPIRSGSQRPGIQTSFTIQYNTLMEIGYINLSNGVWIINATTSFYPNETITMNNYYYGLSVSSSGVSLNILFQNPTSNVITFTGNPIINTITYLFFFSKYFIFG